MRELPILMNGPMVRAVLEGRKTVTRRLVKPAGAVHVFPFIGANNEPTGEFGWCPHPCYISQHIRCPYGQPGDRLWVRETCGTGGYFKYPWAYRADGIEYPGERWTPAIHMPRRASRITLEVTDVRVERLQDITEQQARMEGCAPAWLDANDNETVHAHAPPTYRQGFARLWREINGADSWEANPWVWTIAFRRLDGEQRNG